MILDGLILIVAVLMKLISVLAAVDMEMPIYMTQAVNDGIIAMAIWERYFPIRTLLNTILMVFTFEFFIFTINKALQIINLIRGSGELTVGSSER